MLLQAPPNHLAIWEQLWTLILSYEWVAGWCSVVAGASSEQTEPLFTFIHTVHISSLPTQGTADHADPLFPRLSGIFLLPVQCWGHWNTGLLTMLEQPVLFYLSAQFLNNEHTLCAPHTAGAQKYLLSNFITNYFIFSRGPCFSIYITLMGNILISYYILFYPWVKNADDASLI